MRKIIKGLVTFLLLFPSITLQAQTIYKCPEQGEGGSTLYTEIPCLDGAGESIDQNESRITPIDGMSASERRTLRFLENDRGAAEYTRPRAPYRSRQVSHSDSACDTARAALENWRDRMRQGYDPSMSNYMHDRQCKLMRRRDKACF